ncbi:hypothetical protein [Pararhodobacter sp. CCB-MM2]|uniref:hypothetical protein n=1 Tax=Pararhodobacter sp. CCB-MM2 TaxID=1786003 RepID=UPI00083608DD|nr:hypothetical protein [Pararhodobacter sp. CCB-MM2]
MRHFASLAFFALVTTPTLAQSPNSVWQYHRSIGETPLQTSLFLVRGVPETDDMQAQGHCNIGANWIYADLILAYDVSALNEGDAVEVEYIAGDYRMYHDATVIKQEEGTWGVQVAFPLDDPIWGVLSRSYSMTYQVPGGEVLTLDLTGSFAPVTAFAADCARIGDL